MGFMLRPKYPLNRLLKPGKHRAQPSCFSALTLLLISLSLVPAIAVADLPERPGYAGIIFHITDFGINQWYIDYQTGQNFGPRNHDGVTPNRVYTDICGGGSCAAQILLVMPKNTVFDGMSHTERKADLSAQLRRNVDLAIKNGAREFEIQLVQHINNFGYADPKQQRRARNFGRAAYEAIGEIRLNLVEQQKLSVYTDATVGSNGTVMLTENTASWSGYLQAADLITGRASMQATIKTIDTVRKLTGGNNVRIFAAQGDYPAANRPQAWLLRGLPALSNIGQTIGKGPKISIGNAHVLAEIKRQRPATETYLIKRLDHDDLPPYKQAGYFGKSFPGTGHNAAMNGRDMAQSTFRAKQIVPNKTFGFRTTPGAVVSYNDLRARGGIATSRLDDLTRPVAPIANAVPRQMNISSIGRGGVLMTFKGETKAVDLRQLRENILERSGDSSLTWEVVPE